MGKRAMHRDEAKYHMHLFLRYSVFELIHCPHVPHYHLPGPCEPTTQHLFFLDCRDLMSLFNLHILIPSASSGAGPESASHRPGSAFPKAWASVAWAARACVYAA